MPASGYTPTLAKLAGAEVHGRHVLGGLADQLKSMVQPKAISVLERDVDVHAIKGMEAFCKERPGGEIPNTTAVMLGIPSWEIIYKAVEISAGLIAAGTHGRTGLELIIVGSTAERLVRRSPVAILTVRSNKMD